MTRKMHRFLSERDRERIAQAVRLAEEKTSGEIVSVLVEASDRYRTYGLLLGMVTAGLGVLAADLLFPPLTVLRTLAAEGVGFLGGLALFLYCPSLVRFLVPPHERTHRAHERALVAFLNHGVGRTAGRTGILIFASLAERRVEVVADEGIHKKVAEGTWRGVVKLVVDGIRKGDTAGGWVEAVHRAGEILSEHFPKRGKGGRRGRLPDAISVERE